MMPDTYTNDDPFLDYDQEAIDEEAAQIDYDAINAENALMVWEASRPVVLESQDSGDDCNCPPF